MNGSTSACICAKPILVVVCWYWVVLALDLLLTIAVLPALSYLFQPADGLNMHLLAVVELKNLALLLDLELVLVLG